MVLSDNHVVEKVRQGDLEAYGELVFRHQRSIYNLMYRFSQSQHDADELTQEVFCKAYEKLANFGDGRNFFPWLYTLALNHGRDWFRRQQTMREGLHQYAGSCMVGEVSSTPEKFEKEQEISQMYRALARLPRDRQEMLLLRYQQELSIGELGEIFNLSDSGVKMRIHRSLAQVSKYVEEECDGK